MKFYSIFLACLIASTTLADPKQFYFNRFKNESQINDGEEELKPILYMQRLDHQSETDLRLFPQRYYVDSQYAESKNSPVFYYLSGEATCTGKSMDGYIREHAKKFKAHLVALEHRYYGESQPFDSLTTENLKYLSTENALVDAATFLRWLKEKNGWTGPWVVFGGSYAGSLSAYFRNRYPDLVVGSLASSPPVQARENFEEYDYHVATTVTKECAAAMRVAVKKAEASLDNPELLETYKEMFQAEALKEKDNFLYLIADMGALAVQYGYRNYFCNLLTTMDPLEGYAEFTREIFTLWEMDALSMSAEAAESLNPEDYIADFGMRQWFYQSCTEYGYWQNAYHDADISVRSSRINMDYHRNLCQKLFGIETGSGIDKINSEFYEPLLRETSSRIFFSNGSEDPWSKLSITKEIGNDTNPAHQYITIAGASHCDDLREPDISDTETVRAAREMFSDVLANWLMPGRGKGGVERGLGLSTP